MPIYAHTHPDFPDPKDAATHWEPLFTPFGENDTKKCESMVPTHGHLNKVAYWTAKSAAEMFPKDSPEAKSAHHWGYLTGLWHDLGKFAPEWQTYLASKSDPHTAKITGSGGANLVC